MLLSVILMMKKDQDDEWRPIQRKNFALEAKRREVELQAIVSKDFEAEKSALAEQVRQAAMELEKSKAEPANAELFVKLDVQQRLVDTLGDELKSLNVRLAS